MADICKQIHVTVPNAVGKLAEVTGKFAAAGVNILALCAWGDGDTGHMLACTSDAEAACAAVGGEGECCSFQEAVCVKMPNTPGTLNAAASKLAEAGISIDCVFATGCDADEVCVVFLTDDNAKAAEIL